MPSPADAAVRAPAVRFSDLDMLNEEAGAETKSHRKECVTCPASVVRSGLWTKTVAPSPWNNWKQTPENYKGSLVMLSVWTARSPTSSRRCASTAGLRRRTDAPSRHSLPIRIPLARRPGWTLEPEGRRRRGVPDPSPPKSTNSSSIHSCRTRRIPACSETVESDFNPEFPGQP
jgi:hypothetical protein